MIDLLATFLQTGYAEFMKDGIGLSSRKEHMGMFTSALSRHINTF